jgi:hypothetical protein
MIEESSPQAADTAVTSRGRPLRFLGTYIGGAALVSAIFAGMSAGGSFEEVMGMFFVILFGAIIFLPWGVLWGIQWMAETLTGTSPGLLAITGLDVRPANPGVWLLLILSYGSFLVLMILGSITKSQKTFRLVYLMFVFLLILNMGGCLLNPP